MAAVARQPVEVQQREHIAELERREDELLERNRELETENATLRAENADLRDQLARAKKNSRNSSKPPSSDIVKPKKAPPESDGDGAQTKRKIGAQPGHVKHERPPFDPSKIDQYEQYTRDTCPDCGGCLHELDGVSHTVQQVEIIQPKVQIIEHVMHRYECACCQKTVQAQAPPSVDVGGLIGPGLAAYIGYLRGPCRLSFSQIRSVLKDTMDLDISSGLIAKVINKVSAAMNAAYQQVMSLAREQGRLNIDETGHKNNGDQLYTWAFCNDDLSLFHIGGRSCDELIAVLGEDFDGVIGCDLFSAYQKFMREFGVEIQLCLAHLIRDLKFLAEHPRDRVRAYGQSLLEAVRELFRIIHGRDVYESETAFQARLLEQKRVILARGADALEEDGEAWTMAKRLEKHGESYFTFITTPGIAPTNNEAEQALRFVVIHRKITQGTRGRSGQKWWERIWTVTATCKKQGQSIHDFITRAVVAYYSGQPPALIFNPPSTT